MLHDLNNAILIITCAADIALAAYLAAKDRKNATNISFGIVLICLAIWGISFIFWSLAKDPVWVKFWINMTFFAVSLLPAFFLYFSIVFPKPDFIRLKLNVFSSFLPALVFGAASFTPLLAESASPPYMGPEHGQWYLLFVAYIIAYLAYSFYIIASKHSISKGKEKLQFQYLITGTLITVIFGFFLNIFLVSKDIIRLGPVMVNVIGPSSTLIMAGFVAYALLKRELLDFDIFLARATIIVSAVIFAAGSVNIIFSGDTQFLIPFYGILAAASIGFYVLFKNRSSEINRSFFALSACLAFWMYAALKFAASSHIPSAVLWGKLVFIGPILIPPIFYYFVHVFPRKIKDLSSYQKILMFLLPLAALAALPTDFILKEVSMTEGGPSSVFGVGYNLLIAYFIIYIGYGITNMINKHNTAVGIEKMQAKYLLLSLALSAVFVGITNLLLPWAGEFRFAAYGPLFTLIFVGMTAYAIGVRRLLSIEFMLQKGIIYLVISMILTLFYVLAGLISGQSAADVLGGRILIAVMFFALLASMIYRPVYGYIQAFADKLLYGERYDYQKTLLNMSRGITSVIKLSELIGLIVSNFLDTIKVKEISVLVFDENRKKFKSVPCDIKTTGRYKKIEFDAGSPIDSWLSSKRDILVRDEIESEIDKHYHLWAEKGMLSQLQALRDELESLGMAVWVPVISKERLIAMICLGYKMSGDMYTDEDIGLLKTLANQVAVALENSMMYSTIAKQYEELKLTKDKLVEADKLASLGTMAAGMAHEIKNPLSSMKVFSQLLHERYQDEEFRRKFEEIIPKEINRIDRIVEGLLSFARSPELQLSQVNMAGVVEEVLSDFEEDIGRSGIKVSKRYGEEANVLADREQILRAFSNLILNAIQAMPGGGALNIDIDIDKPPKTVTVKISDTGHGISKEHLNHIFDPFFTTRHYGTGLGLTISHSIIIKHKGAIDVKSETGKGTTVTVALPVS